MRFRLLPSLLLLIPSGCSTSPSAVGAGGDAFLAGVISRLESSRSDQPPDERPAFDAAIDALRRLQEHHGWPVVNTPTEQAYLRGSWVREGRSDGYHEVLTLGTESNGHWDQEAGAIPFGFAWLIEGKHLRMLTQDYYHEAFNYQILERTYAYELSGDHLVLRRNGEALRWTRAPK